MKIQVTSQRNETRTSTFKLLLHAGAAHLWYAAVIDAALNAAGELAASVLQIIAQRGFW